MVLRNESYIYIFKLASLLRAPFKCFCADLVETIFLSLLVTHE